MRMARHAPAMQNPCRQPPGPQTTHAPAHTSIIPPKAPESRVWGQSTKVTARDTKKTQVDTWILILQLA